MVVDGIVEVFVFVGVLVFMLVVEGVELLVFMVRFVWMFFFILLNLEVVGGVILIFGGVGVGWIISEEMVFFDEYYVVLYFKYFSCIFLLK